MIDFSVPVKDKDAGGFFNFSVETGCIMFAGSRYLTLLPVNHKKENIFLPRRYPVKSQVKFFNI